MIKRRNYSWTSTSEPFNRQHIVAVLALVSLFWSVLAAWGSLAPIGGAVIASGIVGAETYRKAVQHLEGGIVRRIAIKEGSKVKAGDVLIELQDVASASSVERTATQYFEALAATSRLIAERDGLPALSFPTTLQEAGTLQRQASAAMSAQRRIFESRRSLHRQKLSVLDKKIERLGEEIKGLEGLIQSIEQQIALVDGVRRDAESLLEKQLMRKSRVAEISRQQAELTGKLSEARAQIGQNRQQMSELDLQKTELTESLQAEIAEELRQQQAKAFELAPTLETAQDVQTRSKVRAPIDGTVVGLQVHSREGVIAKGQMLMEIIPDSDNLVVDASIRPEDISEIHTGLPAQVLLRTPSRRSNQPIPGHVESLSADRLVDKVTSRPYYLARIKIDANAMTSADARIIAGMSADVFIQLDDRTVLEYLAAPLLRSFNRGMRER